MALITFSRPDFILEIVCPWEKHDCTTSLIRGMWRWVQSQLNLWLRVIFFFFYQDWSFTFEKYLSQWTGERVVSSCSKYRRQFDCSKAAGLIRSEFKVYCCVICIAVKGDFTFKTVPCSTTGGNSGCSGRAMSFHKVSLWDRIESSLI